MSLDDKKRCECANSNDSEYGNGWIKAIGLCDVSAHRTNLGVSMNMTKAGTKGLSAAILMVWTPHTPNLHPWGEFRNHGRE